MSSDLSRKLVKLLKSKPTKEPIYVMDCQSGDRTAVSMATLMSEVYKPTTDKESSV